MKSLVSQEDQVMLETLTDVPPLFFTNKSIKD